jgi:hypothetical protein
MIQHLFVSANNTLILEYCLLSVSEQGHTIQSTKEKAQKEKQRSIKRYTEN